MKNKFNKDYFTDGIAKGISCYENYRWIPELTYPMAHSFYNFLELRKNSNVLEYGCANGFLVKCLKDFGVNSFGVDISSYAIENSKEEIRENIVLGNSNNLPWPDNYFDLVISITTLHNLYNFDLFKSLKEIERVARFHKYICVESYRNEVEKANLLYWQVTCEAFNTPIEWEWIFNQAGYTGDYSFIYFE